MRLSMIFPSRFVRITVASVTAALALALPSAGALSAQATAAKPAAGSAAQPKASATAAATAKPMAQAAAKPAGDAKAKPGTAAAAAKGAKAAPLVDINHATVKELKSIPGIGDAYAAKIIAGRPYANKSQLVSRNIMNPSLFETIQGMIIAKQ